MENLKGRDHLGHPGTDGRIIITMYLRETASEDVNWIELTQDRVQ
jgi:hypothetical protein